MTFPPLPSRVAVTGASGFLGAALVRELEGAGVTVHRLVRHAPERPTDIVWDPGGGAGTLDTRNLEGVDAVVHLAGEPIAQRWTAERKRRIHESRVRGTETLARAIAQLRRPPSVLLSGSAVGIYGDRGDALLDEASAPGEDFLARVAVAWEEAAAPVRAAGIRLATLRTGLVLGRGGGVLGRLLLPFRLGAGGRLGSGRQWTSWIALPDWLGAVRHALVTPAASGPLNLVAPTPVTNDELTRTLGFVLHRPTPLPVPAFALRALFGEMADAALLASQRAVPAKLVASGYQFRYPTLEPALEAAIR